MHQPRATVLMAVYNGAIYVREAIDSILEQTFADFEFLIVDDASTDASSHIIASYTDDRIRVFRNERNLGLPSCLNIGLSVASGEYVVRMDCDDVSLPERLSTQIAFMDSNPAVGAAGCWVERIGRSHGVSQYETAPEKIRCGLLFGNRYLAHPSMILRRSFFVDNDLFYDPAFEYSQDTELWTRSVEYFWVTNVPQVLLKYRIASIAQTQERARKKHQYAMEIARKNLRKLGIESTHEEASMHVAISKSAPARSRYDINARELWLKRLRRQNLKVRTYDDRVLSAVIADQWLKTCKAGRVLGPWILGKYLLSSLPKRNLLSISHRRFLISSILGAKRIAG